MNGDNDNLHVPARPRGVYRLHALSALRINFMRETGMSVGRTDRYGRMTDQSFVSFLYMGRDASAYV